MSELIEQEIPVLGAIACGEYVRSFVGKSVFVAGRAIVDAYNYERQQNWVGIMIAPSALRRVRDVDLRKRCTLNAFDTLNFADLDSLAWPSCIQHCAAIPFHGPRLPLVPPTHDGFAVIPGSGTTDPTRMFDAMRTTRERLDWLCSDAPSPAEQDKYQATIDWFANFEPGLGTLAGSYDAWKAAQAEFASQYREIK